MTRFPHTHRLISLAIALFLTHPTSAEGHGDWYVEMAGVGSTKRTLPFWSHTNKGGVYPETCGGLLRGGVSGTNFGKNSLRLDWGIGLAGYAAAEGNSEVHNSDGSSLRGMVQELYVGAGWKKLSLDLGVRRRAVDFGGLSGVQPAFGLDQGTFHQGRPFGQIRFRGLRALGQQVRQTHLTAQPGPVLQGQHNSQAVFHRRSGPLVTMGWRIAGQRETASWIIGLS